MERFFAKESFHFYMEVSSNIWCDQDAKMQTLLA